MPNTTDNQGCAFTRIQSHASGAAVPTPAQVEARNYKLGRTVIHGLKVAIENPRGSVRSGVSPDGKAWQNRMQAHYGEFSGTRGADGDAVDVFVGEVPESKQVWVINQKDPKGGFDEHKVMLGFLSEQQARDAYKFSFDLDWKGLGTIVPATLSQLKWWLKHGNMRIALTADQLPHPEEGTPTMDRVLWNPDATPAYTTLAKALYDIRAHDGSDGLVFDAVTMDDIMSDQDITGRIELDALVVEVGRMQQKMTQVQAIMKAAATGVQPVDFTISDPVKSRGTMQVAVLFSMNDGQTITVWFHNPDTTPNKLTPMDELISWKWMLNKKDVTIVVAPEYGKDMNVREVSRRIMKLIEKNSEGFKRANAKAGERVTMIESLKGEITALQNESSDLDTKIAQAEADSVERERVAALPVVPAWKKMTPAELASPEGFAMVNAGGESALVDAQDFYDHLFQGRLIAVRNALRAMGWEGENFGSLSKSGYSLAYELRKVGAANIVGITYKVNGVDGFSLVDILAQSPEEMAVVIDAILPDPKRALEEIEYNGIRIYPMKVRTGEDVVDNWAVESADNKARRESSERALGGDSLHQTLEEAKKAADLQIQQDADRLAWVAQMKAEEDARSAAAAARAEATKGMTMAEIKAIDHLNSLVKDGDKGDAITRAEWIKRRVEAGAKPTVEMVDKVKPMSRLALNRASNEEQRAHERKVTQGGKIPQYWLGNALVNKTEYDYAVKLLEASTFPIPAADTRTPLENWAAELAPILTKQGYSAYSKARSKIAGDNGLNANEELDLGRLVEGIVGSEAMTLERAKFDPFIQGTNAAYRGDASIPPEGLSEEQRAGWLKGFDSRSGVVEPDDSIEITGREFGEGSEGSEVVNLINKVDDAYLFARASDRFKEYVADTVGEDYYSMFASAKDMDEAAKSHGAEISWDVEEVGMLDSVGEKAPSEADEPDDEEGEDFDPEAEFDACPAMGPGEEVK